MRRHETEDRVIVYTWDEWARRQRATAQMVTGIQKMAESMGGLAESMSGLAEILQLDALAMSNMSRYHERISDGEDDRRMKEEVSGAGR
jgi:nicotinate-nucleotide pyrophosphorylase